MGCNYVTILTKLRLIYNLQRAGLKLPLTHLHVVKSAVFDPEADGCSYGMKTLKTGCSGIYADEVVLFVVYNF